MEFEYKQEHSLSWGYYKCRSCNSEFFDIKEPLHKNGCDSPKLIYLFGPREAKRVILFGNSVFSGLKKEHLDKLLREEQRKFILETPDSQLFSQ